MTLPWELVIEYTYIDIHIYIDNDIAGYLNLEVGTDFLLGLDLHIAYKHFRHVQVEPLHITPLK